MNITVKKNGIPLTSKSPFVNKRIRVGTPAVQHGNEGRRHGEDRDLIYMTLTGFEQNKGNRYGRVKELTDKYLDTRVIVRTRIND